MLLPKLLFLMLKYVNFPNDIEKNCKTQVNDIYNKKCDWNIDSQKLYDIIKWSIENQENEEEESEKQY